jgi:hypothetical protein
LTHHPQTGAAELAETVRGFTAVNLFGISDLTFLRVHTIAMRLHA